MYRCAREPPCRVLAHFAAIGMDCNGRPAMHCWRGQVVVATSANLVNVLKIERLKSDSSTPLTKRKCRYSRSETGGMDRRETTAVQKAMNRSTRTPRSLL